MLKPGIRLWVGFVVSVLGLAVGASNLVRGFDGGIDARNIVVGAICIVLATGWLLFLLLRLKRDESQ